MLEELMLTKKILNTRELFKKENNFKYFKNINGGLCTEFAEDVINQLGGETENLFEVNQFCFMRRVGIFKCVWDIELLSKCWNINPPKNLTWDILNEIKFGDHCWIVFNNLHYDAECPKGVVSFFDLPIFKRQIYSY